MLHGFETLPFRGTDVDEEFQDRVAGSCEQDGLTLLLILRLDVLVFLEVLELIVFL
jgi:hypothetical protein